MYSVPRIGVATIVLCPSLSHLCSLQLLMGKRIGSHGSGTWSFPGGHLEFGESVEDCSKREVLEETGLEIEIPKKNIFHYTENIFPDFNRHYITIYSLAIAKSIEPILKEPEKCEEWQWVHWYDLVDGKIRPLFSPIEKLLKTFDLPKVTMDLYDGSANYFWDR